MVLLLALLMALLRASLTKAWICQRTGKYAILGRSNNFRSCKTQEHSIQLSQYIAQTQENDYPHLRDEQRTIPWQAHPQKRGHHIVNGMECREITIDLPVVGGVTVLEATADAQNALVDVALTMDDVVDEQNPQTNQKEQQDAINLNFGDPYGAVLWPAASAVATRLLQVDSNHLPSSKCPTKPLHGLTIVELGAGTGLISLAALKAGADKVIAVDYEPIPLQLLQYAAAHLNPGCLDHDNNLQCVLINLEAEFTPLCQTLIDDADILVAADILYHPSTGVALAKWIVEFLRTSRLSLSRLPRTPISKRVLVGDSPGRPGRPVFLQELQRLNVTDPTFFAAVGRTCSGPRHELICGSNSLSISEIPQELEVAILELTSNNLLRVA